MHNSVQEYLYIYTIIQNYTHYISSLSNFNSRNSIQVSQKKIFREIESLSNNIYPVNLNYISIKSFNESLNSFVNFKLLRIPIKEFSITHLITVFKFVIKNMILF